MKRLLAGILLLVITDLVWAAADDVLYSENCFVVPSPFGGGTVDACLEISFNTCDLELDAGLKVAGVEVIAPEPITASGKICGDVAIGLCQICATLEPATTLTGSGAEGCFAVTLECVGQPPIPAGEQCFALGDTFECTADSCAECASKPNCGWCLASGECLVGNAEKPKCRECTGADSCSWFFDGCPSYGGVCPVCPPAPPPPLSTPQCKRAAEATGARMCSAYLRESVFLVDDGRLQDESAGQNAALLGVTGQACEDAAEDAARNASCLLAFPPCEDGVSSKYCPSVCSELSSRMQLKSSSCTTASTGLCSLAAFASEGEPCFDFFRGGVQVAGAVPTVPGDATMTGGADGMQMHEEEVPEKSQGFGVVRVAMFLMVILFALVGWFVAWFVYKRKSTHAEREDVLFDTIQVNPQQPQRSRPTSVRQDASESRAAPSISTEQRKAAEAAGTVGEWGEFEPPAYEPGPSQLSVASSSEP